MTDAHVSYCLNEWQDPLTFHFKCHRLSCVIIWLLYNRLEATDKESGNDADPLLTCSPQQPGVRELLTLMCAAHVEAAMEASRLAAAATAQATARDAISASTRLAIRVSQPSTSHFMLC